MVDGALQLGDGGVIEAEALRRQDADDRDAPVSTADATSDTAGDTGRDA